MLTLFSNTRSIGGCVVCTTITNLLWKVTSTRWFKPGTRPDGTIHACVDCADIIDSKPDLFFETATPTTTR